MADTVQGSKYAPVPGKIPGLAINLGGQSLVLAPLNLAGVKAFMALQGEFKTKVSDLDSLAAITAQALHLSLVRNYPDMSVDDVLALLDVANIHPAMDAIAEASGFVKAEAGEPGPASQ